MSSKMHPVEATKIACLVLVLVGVWIAITTWAWASGTEGSPVADVRPQQETPDVSESEQAPDTGREQRRAAREARRKGFLERIRLARQNTAQSNAVPPALTAINVVFKLDPRLSGPTYGGERWVSPPIFMGASAQDTVEARVEGVDARGRPVRITPRWTPGDPEMVEISPAEGSSVKIIVKRAGESTVEVASHGISKRLSIKAEYKGNALHVQLSQKP
ncbi:MAG TPA: hypothetical protein VLM91_29055 [Candidatus Methylomirabilis sp.]|nr:hypothetical protein [Candidatus Methylomirabilis sp.]